MHNDEVLRRFYQPTRVGELVSPSGQATDGNQTCGDVVQVGLEVTDGVISDARFKTFGCVVAIAASDAVCEMTLGMTPSVAAIIDLSQVLDVLGPIDEERIPCASSALEAVRAAARHAMARAPEAQVK